MFLRLALLVPWLGLIAACGGDDGGSNETTGDPDSASMTMTLTMMTTADTGDEADSSSSGGSASDGGSSSGPPLPECPGQCVGLAPEGWSGPVATLDSDPMRDAPECPRAFATLAVEAFEDFDASPAECDCACGAATGVICEQTATLRSYGAVADCSGPVVSSVNLTNAVCAPVNFASSTFVALDPVGLLALGSCEPVPTMSLADPTFDNRVTACEASVMAGFSCDDTAGQGCLAELPSEPLAERLCIWQEGEHDCPDDTPYIDDRILWSAFTDERGCTECTCGDPVGVCDNSNAIVYGVGTCTPPVTALTTGEGFCVETSVGSLSARYIAGAPTAFCPPSEVMPSGSAEEAEPVTLCCTQ